MSNIDRKLSNSHKSFTVDRSDTPKELRPKASVRVTQSDSKAGTGNIEMDTEDGIFTFS
jgi:hypothetical protein